MNSLKNVKTPKIIAGRTCWHIAKIVFNEVFRGNLEEVNEGVPEKNTGGI